MRIIVCSSDVCSSDLLLLVAQVRALHQPLVQADRAVDLATPTEKMPQCNLGLEGVLVQLRDVQEQLDRLVGLFVEQVVQARSEEHTSELQSLMRISYAVFCLKKKTHKH